MGIEVSIPVIYADGQLTSIVVEVEDGAFLVHDAGEAAMRLSSLGIPLKRVDHVAEIVARFRCNFINGRVTSRADSISGIGVVASLVANASRSVADLAHEVRRQTETEFRSVVSDRLREAIGSRVRENQEFKGRSGRRYRIPALILDRTQAHPTHFVSALATRQTVPLSVSMFFDLRGAHPNVENDAIYDDSSDFRDEDRALLASISTVIGLMEVPLKFRAMVGV
ncbi:MAG: hypothetical protein JOY67_06720 [Hyphomicrobiales bacterium]|nr:hypothetical protein [Hyphomicrobiales bacterium]